MAAQQPIDDWEEISDTYSVVSIPSSDDEAVVIPSPKRKTNEARPPTPPKKATEATAEIKPAGTKPRDPRSDDATAKASKAQETKHQDTKSSQEAKSQEPKSREDIRPKLQQPESPNAATSDKTKTRKAPTSRRAPIIAPSRSEPSQPQVSSQTPPPCVESKHVARTLAKGGTKAAVTTAKTASNISVSAASKPFDPLQVLGKPPTEPTVHAELKPKAERSSTSQPVAASVARVARNSIFNPDILDTDLASRTYYKGGNIQTRKTLPLGTTNSTLGSDAPDQFPSQFYGLRSADVAGDEAKARNYDHDPVSALATLRSVSQVLNEVTASLERFATSELRNSRVHDLVHHCNLLQDQIKRLLPILEGYSTFWKSSRPSKYHSTPSTAATLQTHGHKPVPLNPSLLTWMTILGSKLDEVKIQMQEERNKLGRNRVLPTTMLGARLDGLEPGFITLTGQMVDLLPIMEIDYNVYKREALSFPLPGEFPDVMSPQSQPSTQPVRHQPAPPPGTAQNSRLRQELRKLKDSLYDVLDFLGRHQNGYQINDMAQLISSFDAIFAALSMILSPEKAGWSGNVPSYPEDRDIDDAIIRDINDRLDDICLRRGVSSGAWSYYQEEERSRGIYALADNDNLDSLRTCATVLTAILIPQSE